MKRGSRSAVTRVGSAFSRRGFLGLCAAAGSWGAASARADATAQPARSGTTRDLRWVELRLRGHDGARTQALVCAPVAERRAFSLEFSDQRYPALLLLHGAGGSASLEAWRSRYGLFDRYAELRRPPVALGPERARFMRPSQLARLNAELEQRPFAGLVLICPTPPAPDASEAVIADYCEWLERTLLPRAAALGHVDETPCLGVAGDASGARLALEVFARKPHLFRTFGAALPDLDQGAGSIARRLRPGAARSGFAGIQLQTSAGHRHRAALRALQRDLASRGVAVTLDELLGPAGDASWREAGLLSALAWHERSLQLIERPDPGAAPVESDPPPARQPGPPGRS